MEELDLDDLDLGDIPSDFERSWTGSAASSSSTIEPEEGPSPTARGRPRKKRNATASSWAMTWNNPETHCEDPEAAIRSMEHLLVAVVGKEVAPTTGTPHLQGFLRFRRVKCWTWMCRHLPGARLVPCENDQAMEKYCRKDGDLLLDLDLRHGRDKKKMLQEESFLEALKGDPSRLLEEAGASWTFQNLSRVRLAMAYGPQLLSPSLSRIQPYVVWCFGPAGAGKTLFVRSLLGSVVLKDKSVFFLSAPPSGGKVWWDGISRATEVVVMDDLRPTTMYSGTFCQLVSSLPQKVDCKNTTVDFCASLVLVTAPEPPWCFWPQSQGDGEVAPQVVRRVSLCVEYQLPASSWSGTRTTGTCSSFQIPPPGGVAGDPWETTRSAVSSVMPAYFPSESEGSKWSRVRGQVAATVRPVPVVHWADENIQIPGFVSEVRRIVNNLPM